MACPEPQLAYLQSVYTSIEKKTLLLTLEPEFKSHALSIIPSQRPLGCVYVHRSESKPLTVTDAPYKAVEMADTGHKELYRAALRSISISQEHQYSFLLLLCTCMHVCVCVPLIKGIYGKALYS